MSLTSFMIRFSCTRSDRKRDKGLKTPEDIKRFDDISYGANRYQVLDVYRPANATEVLPVIVSVHGGAWMYGSKEVYQWYCMNLAQRGFAVVNFTYRLAPEYKFPAGIEDTNKVFSWVMENAQMYGFDTENIFAVGDSAGAHMLAVYAAMLTNSEYAVQFDFPLTKVSLKAVALNCGKYEMRTLNNPENAQQKRMLKEILPQKGTDSELLWATPLAFITEQFPPAYIMTATDDFLKDQSPIMAEKLKECGVEHVYHMYGDEATSLGHVFHVDIKREEAKICNDDECAFFRSFIK